MREMRRKQRAEAEVSNSEGSVSGGAGSPGLAEETQGGDSPDVEFFFTTEEVAGSQQQKSVLSGGTDESGEDSVQESEEAQVERDSSLKPSPNPEGMVQEEEEEEDEKEEEEDEGTEEEHERVSMAEVGRQGESVLYSLCVSLIHA